MSKRGGTSEVNGFISIGADSKSIKKKDGSVSKNESGETPRRRTESKKEPTQSRTRMSNESSKKEPSQKHPLEKKEHKPKVVESSNSKLEHKESIKKEPPLPTSKKTVKTYLASDKQKISVPTKELPKSYSEISAKVKGAVSSSSIISKGTKPKTVQSTPQIPGQSKESPYKSSYAQKHLKSQTSVLASGDRLRRTSQLKETPVKSKTPTSKASISRTSKRIESESPIRRKSSAVVSSNSKTKKEEHKKAAIKRSEESDSESQLQSKLFGEIPRSNTFTKEGRAPASQTKEGRAPASQTQGNPASEAADSLSHVDAEDNEYQYEEDFEDYESDFEEYMESDDSSSTPEVTDKLDSSGSSDSDESFDEDEIGDGYRGALTAVSDTYKSDLPAKTILKKDNNSTSLNETAKKQNVNEKEKLTQVEEEKKLDSGSYDLTSHSDLKRRKQIQDIRAAIDKENASLSAKMRQKRKSVTEDEGFEEVFNQEVSPTIIDASFSPTEGLINFENARKQQISQKAKAKVKKRGAVLMEMIKLDVMNFNLLDIPSVPYEVYMQCYGRSNTLQIHTQTNEDATSEEVQTEAIPTSTKWTQHPVMYSSPKSTDDLLYTFSREKLGVGGESTIDEKEDWFPKLHVNSLRLHNFINNAGEMILTLLEEDERDRKVNVISTNKRDFGFSDSYFSLNVQRVKFLQNRPVSMVYFSESNSSNILTIHKPSTEQPLTIQAESEGRCVLCTWSIREPSCPLQTLVASNDVTSVCYHSFLVFAGLVDGALCLWDLREQSVAHARCYLREPEWLLRSPTYITADVEKRQRHSSSVVSIQILPESNPDDSAKSTIEKTPRQVVSLDEDGLLAVWTIVESKSTVNVYSGLAPWGKIRIVQSSQLRVLKAFPKLEQSRVQCRCLIVDRLKPSNLYVGTNTGRVIHVLQTSHRARPQFYCSQSGANTSITCMEFSRCGYPLLMAGDSTGRIQIYRTKTERPLLDLSASDVTPGPSIKCLQWSPTQPGLFFVLDSDSCIHVWDVCSSDMCPQMSVPFTTKTITSIGLTPHPDCNMLAVASAAGSVDVYSLKEEFGSLPKKTSDDQHDIFSRYINIL